MATEATKINDYPGKEQHQGEVLNELALVLKSPTRHHQRQRQDYLERLASFTTLTYFAKPPSLSPIVCARFGWRNVVLSENDNDDHANTNTNADDGMLCCDKCHAVLCISFLPGLSSCAHDNLTRLYEQQLGKAHANTCIFKIPAMKYFCQPLANTGEDAATSDGTDAAASGNAMLVPLPFISYVPDALVDLVESKRPAMVFYNQWKELCHHPNDSNSTKAIHVNLELPIDLKVYEPPSPAATATNNNDASANAAAATTSLGESLVQALASIGKTVNESSSSGELDPNDDGSGMTSVETSALMLLLGWYPTRATADDDGDDNDDATLSVQCQLCRKSTQVALLQGKQGMVAGTTGEEQEPPPAKRLRPSGWDPLYSHRHYCPYVCGFPIHGASSATPLWKSLADRIILHATRNSSSSTPSTLPTTTATNTTTLTTDSQDAALSSISLTGKSEWEQVNALLNSGIARKRRSAMIQSN